MQDAGHDTMGEPGSTAAAMEGQPILYKIKSRTCLIPRKFIFTPF
jgi:hypothetical protein